MPPSEPPKGTKPRRKPAPPTKPKPSAQNAQAYVSQGKAVSKAARTQQQTQRQAQRVQRQTQNAQALDEGPGRPTRPQTVRTPSPQARPLAARPLTSTRAGKPVATPRQQRGLTVAAYDQLSGAGKRGHLAGAAKRNEQGKATEADLTILHAHQSRVAGKQAITRAQQAYDRLAGDQIGGVANEKGGLHYAPGTVRLGGRTISPKGEDLGPAVTAEMVRKQGSIANMPSVGAVIKVAGPLATKGLDKTALPKVIKNIPKDAAELAVTSPSALAKIAVDTAKHPRKAAEELAKPYGTVISQAGHGKFDFVQEHPVTTALMFSPVARAPGLAAGRVARLAGKQTLRRDAAVLEGTALSEPRLKSRSAGRNLLQTRADRKTAAQAVTPGRAKRPTPIHVPPGADTELQGAIHEGNRLTARFNEHKDLANVPAHLWDALDRNHALQRKLITDQKLKRRPRHDETPPVTPSSKPTVTARQINTRVDEAFAGGQKHADRVHNAVMRAADKEAKNRPKQDRKAFLAEMEDKAASSAEAQRAVEIAKEFGATARVQGGKIVEGGAKATRFDTQEEARVVAEHLNAKGQTIPRGHGGLLEDPAGRKYRNEPVPVQYQVIDAGLGKFAVVPKQVADRLHLHSRIGKEKAVPAILLRQTRRALSRSVLPTRPSWLSGQAIEGGARSAVQQAGPTSYMRAHLLQKRHPQIYNRLAERSVPGGLGGRTLALDETKRTLDQEFHGESNLARRATEFAAAPGLKQVRGLYNAYTHFVFDVMNGKVLEGIPQKAMLGRALKTSPLMEQSVLGLSRKAIDNIANGVDDPAVINSLAREVTRGYGKYSAFSPRMRSLIIHWTPFIPWYLNMARFLLQTLPKDHPMVSALIADSSAATEDWRKEQGLSLRYRNDNSLPVWMLGGYPIQGGKNLLRIGHYVPAPGSDPAQDLSQQVLPQFSGAYSALKDGVDWKGQPLKHPDGSDYNTGERILYAVQQMMEAMMPLYGQGTQIVKAKHKKKNFLHQLQPLGTIPTHRQGDAGGTSVPSVDVPQIDVPTVQVK